MSNRIKNILFPAVLLPALAGCVTGSVIFLFKVVAGYVISASEHIYSFARENPIFLPLIILGAALLGVLSAFLVGYERNAGGGGIATSIAIVRGLLTFKWLRNLITVFVSSMVTYFGGVPLGNEGPSVQMGTAIGGGTSRLLAKNHSVWHRYVMTGSAGAGFTAATGAPASGVIFTAEELHERFSPLLILSAASAVGASFGVTKLLCALTGKSSALFHLSVDMSLPFKFVWMAFIVGAICALAAAAYTKVHYSFGNLIHKRFLGIPKAVKSAAVFVLVALVGFFLSESLASGHDLIESLFEGKGVWYMLLAFLAIRMIFMLTANNFTVTGGLFVPNLTFGALIGLLCAKLFNHIGALPSEYNVIIVMIAMSAYLCAISRIPFTATVFGVEALCGIANILPLAVATAASYITLKALRIKTNDEVAVERREEQLEAANPSESVKSRYAVQPDSFAVGKLPSDLLLPYGCEVVSKKRGLIKANDILEVSCKKRDGEALEDIFGKQSVVSSVA